MKQDITKLKPIDKALNFVKSILEKNNNFYGTSDKEKTNG